MTHRDFFYWLRGFLEGADALAEDDVKLIFEMMDLLVEDARP